MWSIWELIHDSNTNIFRIYIYEKWDSVIIYHRWKKEYSYVQMITQTVNLKWLLHYYSSDLHIINNVYSRLITSVISQLFIPAIYLCGCTDVARFLDTVKIHLHPPYWPIRLYVSATRACARVISHCKKISHFKDLAPQFMILHDNKYHKDALLVRSATHAMSRIHWNLSRAHP